MTVEEKLRGFVGEIVSLGEGVWVGNSLFLQLCKRGVTVAVATINWTGRQAPLEPMGNAGSVPGEDTK